MTLCFRFFSMVLKMFRQPFLCTIILVLIMLRLGVSAIAIQSFETAPGFPIIPARDTTYNEIAMLESDHVHHFLSKRTDPRYDKSIRGPHLDSLKASVADSLLMAEVAYSSNLTGTIFDRYFRSSDADYIHNVFRSMMDTDPKHGNEPRPGGSIGFSVVTLMEGDRMEGDRIKNHPECIHDGQILAYLSKSWKPWSRKIETNVSLCPHFWELPVPRDVSCNEARTWETASPRMVFQGSVLVHIWLLIDSLGADASHDVRISDHQGAIGPYGAMKFKQDPENMTPRLNADNFHWWALENWWQHHCERGQFQDPPQPSQPEMVPYIEVP